MSGTVGSTPVTNWSDDQQAQLDSLLRRCIQCGLCLPTCATYLATGSEVQSPRGRLLLLSELISASNNPAKAGFDFPSTLSAFDLCLGCRACETSCPSGVSFELLESGKQLATEHQTRGQRWLTRRLGSRGNLRHLRRLVGGARFVLKTTLGRNWRGKLETAPPFIRHWARRIGTLPVEPADTKALVRMLDDLVARARVIPQEGQPEGAVQGVEPGPGRGSGRDTARGDSAQSTAPTVAFFRGCVNDTLLPGAATRLRALLAVAGCRVVDPNGLTCCGALDRHTGQAARADQLQDRNVAKLAAGGEVWDFLVVEAAGCGLELKSYPDEIASRVADAIVLLDSLQLPPARAVPLRVVVHDPCHARHGQGIASEPRQLLRRIPELDVLDPEEPEVCCGSGGAYSLLHPELSAQMGLRKAKLLAATGADLVVTTNPGCLGQLTDSLTLEAPDLPILPLSDLLWYAHLGGRWA